MHRLEALSSPRDVAAVSACCRSRRWKWRICRDSRLQRSYNLFVVDFDPVKEAKNVRKHGISLARFDEMTNRVFTEDVRHSDRESRWLVYGLIDGSLHAAVITHRADRLRCISLRRASRKERRIYG